MFADFGYGVIVVTLLVAFYAVFASLFGQYKKSQKWVESSRLAMQLTFPLLTLASLVMIYLLVNNQYNVSFVYQVSSRAMPTYLKVTALWGGQAGSLLFWSWLLALFLTAVTLRKWDRDREFLPWVVLVGSITLAFFIGLNVFYENPFSRFWQTFSGVQSATFRPAGAIPFIPVDGSGLNPLLRHPGMIIHPPMLYLGFVGFVIPYAFAIAALITGRTDDRWTQITRRWTLWAWLFLTLGIILGGRWAYDVLGWGGYWAWDPVEIASFMPWLTGTAFLHSVMIQEKRGQLKHWNMILIILTFSLVIFGTFLTRSGVLSSVHSFAQSAIGPAFFVFIGLTFFSSAGLLIWRWPELKGETQMTSVLSREALFLLNNLLFIAILFICFWGVMFPLISELVTGTKVTVGPPYYERAAGPLFAALVLLMGVAPLSAWGHSTFKTLGKAIIKPLVAALLVMAGVIAYFLLNPVLINSYFWFAMIGFFVTIVTAFVTLYDFGRAAAARSRAQKENLPLSFWRLAGRNRRRYGGYTIHLGVILIAIGIIGIEMFQTETQGTIPRGESIQLAGYTMTFKELQEFDLLDARGAPMQHVARAIVDVSKDGQYLTTLYPRRDYYYDSQQPMTIPGVRHSIQDDFYILLVDWEPISTVGATFKIYHNPLVNWMWFGSAIFILGTLVAAWPDKDVARMPARSRKVNVAYQPGD